jgi:adenylate cyclase
MSPVIHMSHRVVAWLYRKLGSFYPATFLTLELHSALLVVLGTLALFSLYYDGTGEQYLIVAATALGLTEGAIWVALLRTYPRLRPLQRWIAGDRTPEATAKAWAAAVELPFGLVRRALPLPILGAVVPTCIVAVIALDLSWLAFFPLFAGSMISVGYAGILHYLVIEAAMRPVLVDINQEAAPRFRTASALSLRLRLMATLPLINLITGLVVAALTSGGGGAANLGFDVLIAVAVATTISLELTVLLSKSILRPIADLRRATDALREGRYDVEIPITTGDELGELATSFNQMVAGLRERERIREAFGTYLDQEIAEYILSEGFSPEGIEVDVSVLVCDVENFTAFANHSEAPEVVAALNELFETVVPIVARHGGHVDKFVGDGLLAVFGAPESFPDHADRAVRAACEMVREVNGTDDGFTIGVGVNTGRVVAGSIGGGGRLNFSVIGDPVNVAARVEATTRDTDQDVLITEQTATRLSGVIEAEPCGTRTVKGIDRPLALYAPRLPERAVGSGDGVADTLGPRLGRSHTLPGR